MLAKLKGKLARDVDFKELLSGSFTAFVFKVGGVSCSYLFTYLVAYYYGAEALGIFAISFSVLNVTTVISKLGLNTIFLRISAQYSALKLKDKLARTYQNVFTLILVSSFIVAVLIFSFSDFIASAIFNKPYLNDLLKIVAIGVFPFTWTYINIEGLRGLKNIPLYAFFESVWPHFGATIFLIIFFYSFSYYQASVLPFVSYTIPSFLAAFITYRAFKSRTGEEKLVLFGSKALTKLSEYRVLLSLALPLLLASSLQLIMGTIDTLMLGAMQSDKEVGIYNVCIKITNVTTLSLLAVNSIVAPKFAEEWGRKNIKALQKIARQAASLTFVGAFPVLLAIFIIPETLLGFFGKEFIAGKSAIIIIALGQCFNIACGSVGYILQMTEHEKAFRNIILISGAINVGLNYYMIPTYSYVGAALASFIATCFWNIVMSIFLYKKLGISVSLFRFKY